jgi:hypothetical protein
MSNAANAPTLPAPPDDWASFRYVGIQTDGDGGWLELRNAPSGTTLSRQILCACGKRAQWLQAGHCESTWLCEVCSRDVGLR